MNAVTIRFFDSAGREVMRSTDDAANAPNIGDMVVYSSASGSNVTSLVSERAIVYGGPTDQAKLLEVRVKMST